MSGATRFCILLTTVPLPRLHHCCPSLRHALRSSLSPAKRHHHHHQSLLPLKASQQFHTQTSAEADQFGSSSSFPLPLAPHPWPDWSKLVNNLSAGGYFYRQGQEAGEGIIGGGGGGEDELLSVGDLPFGFARAANACLAFARERPNLLWELPRRDVEVVVEKGTPFLFSNSESEESVRRMRSSFLGNHNKVLDSDKAQMVDLMKFILSYASSPIVSSEKKSLYNTELVESSVQNLLSELVKLSYSAPESKPFQTVQNQVPDGYGQTPKPSAQNIKMKRGDWICARCSFMNFARNEKCRECQEARPRRQLTGGEWECPQCDFFNYGKNLVCLRCDCKRPGEVSLGYTKAGSGLGYGNENYANNVDVDSRSVANEEKAQRWFSKVSQLDGTSDMGNSKADEDFPEIMPLRKGVNKFVVSTRKTPLERRLVNSQYRRNSDSDGSPEGIDLQSEGVNKNPDKKMSGDTSAVPESDNRSIISGQSAGTNSIPSISSPASTQYRHKGSSYVPFVPLPADKFAKRSEHPKMEENEKGVVDKQGTVSTNATEQTGALSKIKDPGRSGDSIQLSEKPVNQTESKNNEKEAAEKSERWFERIAELHDVEDLASAISDEDFPETMPMLKGENRFVVGKKKDRSLISPMNKRRMAMEQTNNNNFVPFVPLPSDYFAKKDKPQPDRTDITDKVTGESSPSSTMQEKLPERSDDSTPIIINDNVKQMGNQPISTRSSNLVSSTEKSSENKIAADYEGGNPTGKNINTQTSNKDSWSSGYHGKENRNETTKLTGSSTRQPENDNIRAGWTGKSLEGSAVKEPDPLDMSEEAKTERWFRRIAQIKDISELSQIPDEDFPSIMPMRKGVNRFVVSKRKTPLERRLTSPQYRRNLPNVSSESDPMEKENEGS